MSTRHAATDSLHGADDLLANLIEEITQALERGEPVDLEAYALTYRSMPNESGGSCRP